jgi:hypothetical protein
MTFAELPTDIEERIALLYTIGASLTISTVDEISYIDDKTYYVVTCEEDKWKELHAKATVESVTSAIRLRSSGTTPPVIELRFVLDVVKPSITAALPLRAVYSQPILIINVANNTTEDAVVSAINIKLTSMRKQPPQNIRIMRGNKSSTPLLSTSYTYFLIGVDTAEDHAMLKGLRIQLRGGGSVNNTYFEQIISPREETDFQFKINIKKPGIPAERIVDQVEAVAMLTRGTLRFWRRLKVAKNSQPLPVILVTVPFSVHTKKVIGELSAKLSVLPNPDFGITLK